MTRRALESITNVPMSKDVWEQSSLPTSLGGLGIPRSSEIALPAYISSMESSVDMVTVILPESGVREKIAELTMMWQNETGLTAPTEEDCKKQASWSKLQATQKAESILRKADVIS